jgi:hypothetical protein
MEKSASKKVILSNGLEVTISITRSITEIKGDGWETVDETLYIERTSISFKAPNGERRDGSGLSVLTKMWGDDAAAMDKGAYGKIDGACMYLKRESYDVLKSALDEVSADAMFQEWEKYVTDEAAKKLASEIAAAEEVVRAGDDEMRGGKKLMTAAEIKAWHRGYNNIHNEGGSGYVPDRTSIESYNHAKSILGGAK